MVSGLGTSPTSLVRTRPYTARTVARATRSPRWLDRSDRVSAQLKGFLIELPTSQLKSKSPSRTPWAKTAHSSGVNLRIGPSGSVELRTR
jgi:hypothetical protein